MRPFAVTPTVDVHFLLPGTDYADAFALDIYDPTLDAPSAARRAFHHMPHWVGALLTVRNIVVSPFGLRATPDPALSEDQRIGIFPVISTSPERVVMGFDDAHLNFRVVVEVEDQQTGTRRVTATTLVKRNNTFGGAYLRAVMPFHKAIVPAILARVAA
ncbi:MAG: DUF2867 domain-containing protein [Hyphomicrobiaceae bacterium]|nr:DUF2867 domain-containing protein [Hyphomicrobiaceae bacterium]